VIDSYINNCEGITMEMTSQDKEQEVNKWVGIKSYFHMSFNKKSNHYTVRIKECFCSNCMHGKYSKCDNKFGKPTSIVVEVLGDLQAPGKETTRNEAGEADQGEDFVVEKICGVREYRGETQYLVKWEGYEDKYNSWRKIQNLNCPKLLQEFNRASNF
jgi:Chromo (CHRromatin Organisation MOdifier) domain